MNKFEIASEYMKKGYNCAQSIMKAYASEVGMKEEDAVRMASALGGGVGRNGHICGAVSGAALIIGMKFGTTDPADFPAKEKAYNKTNELLEKFSAENKSVLCKRISVQIFYLLLCYNTVCLLYRNRRAVPQPDTV